MRARAMTAGELAEHFDVSKPTMSGHFAVLREADLIDGNKRGTTITYRLQMSILEDALLGFAHTFEFERKRDRAGLGAPDLLESDA
ncbi:MAG: helix-turn-helix domain-containing protein [Gemmatimonadota bacterium]|nr:helix-turn-helix domain-containing protein [Gemmatimonadota bacterium]